jgi:hypothetical protein
MSAEENLFIIIIILCVEIDKTIPIAITAKRYITHYTPKLTLIWGFTIQIQNFFACQPGAPSTRFPTLSPFNEMVSRYKPLI